MRSMRQSVLDLEPMELGMEVAGSRVRQQVEDSCTAVRCSAG